MKLSKKVSLVDVPAFLTRTVNPPLTESSPITLEFETAVLEALAECLWLDVMKDVKAIPMWLSSVGFPYRRHNGSLAFVSTDADQVIKRLPKEGEVECFLCDAFVQLSKMRDHVSMHVLAARFGLRDKNGGVPMPANRQYCGFCGREGTCVVTLKASRNVLIPVSQDCPYYYKFAMKVAEKTTKSGPSTNRPITCPLCTDSTRCSGNIDSSHVVWTYNLPKHLAEKHLKASEDHITDILKQYEVIENELVNLGLQKPKSKQCAEGEKRQREDGSSTDLSHSKWAKGQ
ncbi:hypothetical protein EWM64_g1119 [Hericium alpestre]|uniref:Uncharacterized protein n=1 Tax=Hericium alpestre TaxID=135208 RepID=A0A4Z0A9G5_9AGAM|nr:hypothetical protein EWM64_g1119 [Hericium alpestre]